MPSRRWRLSTSALRSAICPLLPEPITPTEVAIRNNRNGVHAETDAPAIFVVGYLGQRHMAVAPIANLPEVVGFRVLPGFGAPRALIPPSVGGAAERVSFRPRALSEARVSRYKTDMIAQAIHLAWPYVSTPAQIHLPHPSLVVQALREVAPECEIGVFIGNSANYGRSAVQAFGTDGDLLAVCRFITDPATRDRACVEYDLLQELHHQPALRAHIPTPCSLVKSHLGVGVVTDAFKGTPGPTWLTPPLEAWLGLCVSREEIRASSSSIVRQIVDRASTLSDHHHDLTSVAEGWAGQLEQESVRRTIVHGDFTPWNMLMDRGQLRVFDWEYGVVDGLPDWDAVFFELQVGIVHSQWSGERLLTEARMQAARASEHFSPSGRVALTGLVLLEIALRCAERHALDEARRISGAVMDFDARAKNL